MLDVGAGSGYLTSVFYHLLRGAQQQQQRGGSSGTGTPSTSSLVVVGIEHIPVLTALAERNIRADGLGAAIDDEQAIVLVTGDGRLGMCAVRYALPFPSLLSLVLWDREEGKN